MLRAHVLRQLPTMAHARPRRAFFLLVGRSFLLALPLLLLSRSVSAFRPCVFFAGLADKSAWGSFCGVQVSSAFYSRYVRSCVAVETRMICMCVVFAVAVPSEFRGAAGESGFCSELHGFLSGGLSCWVRRACVQICCPAFVPHVRFYCGAGGRRLGASVRLLLAALRHVRCLVVHAVLRFASVRFLSHAFRGGVHVDMTRFSPKQKETWAAACSVAWPCA